MAGLYRGMAMPFGATLSSYFDPKNDREILRTSILMILHTKLSVVGLAGERVMLPGFGSPIHEAPFEPGDETLDGNLEGIVTDNVNFWDKRLEVLEVQVTTDDATGGHEKRVSVVYRDKAVPDSEDRFVFSIPSEVVSRIDQ